MNSRGWLLLGLMPLSMTLLGGCFNPSYEMELSNLSTGNRSVDAYSKTVYPILRRNCSGCHGGIQSPFFAVSDVTRAHDELVQSGKVSFQNPENSRLYVRLSHDLHNCWKDCGTSAAEMLSALKRWNQERGPDTSATQQLKRTEDRLIPETIVTTPVVLSFPIDRLFATPIPGAVFEISVVQFDNFSYRFFAPRIKTRDPINIYVKGVQVLMNGEASNSATTYRIIEQVVAASSNPTQLSNSSLIYEIAKGRGIDRVAIGFEALTLGNDQSLALVRFNTARTLIQTECAGCHTSTIMPFFGAFTQESQYLGLTVDNVPFVIPGNAEGSELYRLVAGTSTPVMPPNASAARRATIASQLKTWIDQIPPR